jgi:hypothetical protein
MVHFFGFGIMYQEKSGITVEVLSYIPKYVPGRGTIFVYENVDQNSSSVPNNFATFLQKKGMSQKMVWAIFWVTFLQNRLAPLQNDEHVA